MGKTQNCEEKPFQKWEDAKSPKLKQPEKKPVSKIDAEAIAREENEGGPVKKEA